MLDGEVDYSRLSREELADVLRHVDAERFPINYANAMDRYRSLEVPIAVPPEKNKEPAKSRGQLVAEALQLHVSAKVLAKYAALQLVTVGMVNFVVSEIIVIRALALGQTSNPITRISSPYVTAATLVTALLVYVLLAKRHPRGYFVTATCVVLVAGAVDLALGITFQPAAATHLLPRFIPSLVSAMAMITLAGFLCGLMPLPGEQPHTEEADPGQRS